MPCGQTDFTRGKWDQAGAQAFYACKYFEAVEAGNVARNLIAGIQKTVSFYFADKQYSIQRANLDRLNTITEQQVATAAKLQKQYELGIPCENAQTNESCSVAVAAPDYSAIRSRITAAARLTFAQARRRIARRYSVHCKAAMCAEERRIDLAEATAVIAGIEAAFRKEEALHEVRLATAWTRRFNTLQHLRGLQVNAGSYLSGAMASAVQASNINPYYGFSQAANGLAGALTGMTYQNAGSALTAQSAFNSAGLRQINDASSSSSNWNAGRESPDGISQELAGWGDTSTNGVTATGGVDGFSMAEQDSFLGGLPNG